MADKIVIASVKKIKSDLKVRKLQAAKVVKALKSGRRLDGEPMLPPMPWQNLAAYSDNELHAIAAFLMSVKAVSHKVPDKLGPGQPPTGSFVVFPAPSSWDAPKSAPAGMDTTKK